MKSLMVGVLLLIAAACFAGDPAPPANVLDALGKVAADELALSTATASIASAQSALDKARQDQSTAAAAKAKDLQTLVDLIGQLYGPSPVTPPVAPPVNPPGPGPNPSQAVSVLVVCTPNCLPCNEITPTVEAMQQQAFPIAKFVTEDDSLYNTQNYPTLILFRNGKEADRKIGVMTVEEIKAWVGPVQMKEPAKTKPVPAPGCTDKSCPCNQPTWNPRKIGK